MKSTRKVLSKIWLLGKGTAAVMGLAVMLAVMFGVGTTALAAVPGDPFKLGQSNAVNALTRLVGSTNNAMLRLDNNSTGVSATALDLQVKPGKPPMKVNSSTTVQGLNVDQVDGRNAEEFLSARATAVNASRLGFRPPTEFVSKGGTYIDSALRTGDPNGFISGDIRCDIGDEVLGGGYGLVDEGAHVFGSEPDRNTQGWSVGWKGDSQIRVTVLCADYPPLR